MSDIVPPITAGEARGNSRAVSAAEFQELARKGREKLRAIQSADWWTKGLDTNWDEIKRMVYAEVQKPWGGVTIDPRSGRALAQGADLYALTANPGKIDRVSIGEHATWDEFAEVMDTARGKYAGELTRGGTYLGIFHDDLHNRIDFDPVTIVATPADVESIGAYTHAIGGAYHFATGNGYFPPHVTDEKPADEVPADENPTGSP
jgi:hypothetical protein